MYWLHTKGEVAQWHKVAKSLGNQARGVQPARTMTTCTQNFLKNQVDK